MSAASSCHNTLLLATKTRWHTSIAAGRALLPGGDLPPCLSSLAPYFCQLCCFFVCICCAVSDAVLIVLLSLRAYVSVHARREKKCFSVMYMGFSYWWNSISNQKVYLITSLPPSFLLFSLLPTWVRIHRFSPFLNFPFTFSPPQHFL